MLIKAFALMLRTSQWIIEPNTLHLRKVLKYSCFLVVKASWDLEKCILLLPKKFWDIASVFYDQKSRLNYISIKWATKPQRANSARYWEAFWDQYQ